MLRPETSTTRAVAVTVRPTGWREMADVDLAADGRPPRRQMRRHAPRPQAISIARIIIGVPKTNGMPLDMGADREFARDDDLMPAGHADPNILERLRHRWRRRADVTG